MPPFLLASDTAVAERPHGGAPGFARRDRRIGDKAAIIDALQHALHRLIQSCAVTAIGKLHQHVPAGGIGQGAAAAGNMPDDHGHLVIIHQLKGGQTRIAGGLEQAENVERGLRAGNAEPGDRAGGRQRVKFQHRAGHDA